MCAATTHCPGAKKGHAVSKPSVAKRLDDRRTERGHVKAAKAALARAEKAAGKAPPARSEAQRRAQPGRPPVDPLMRCTVAIATKVTGLEHGLIMAKAAEAGMTVSMYLRQIAKTGRVNPRIVRSPAAADPALLAQLIPVASNLNQIAHRLNAMRGYVPAELTRNLSALSSLLEQIHTLDEPPETEPTP